MSTLKPTKKISRRQELRQDTVVTWSARIWELADRYRALTYALLAVVVLVAAGMVGYSYLQQQRDAEGQEYLAPAVKLFEKGGHRDALEGNGLDMGLLDIAEEFGGTQAGNLAHFYAADALFRLGEYEEALGHFQAFDKQSNYLGASALAGEAAIYEARGDYERAGELYRRAAAIFPNDLVSPDYLLDAGRAFELAEQYEDAVEAYELVGEEYPNSSQAREVEMLVARVEAKRESRS